MNSKGQLMFPFVVFIILLFGLLVGGIFFLKFLNTLREPLVTALNNTNVPGLQAGATTADTFIGRETGLWDKTLSFIFFGLIVLLIVSSFLIDTHPFWIGIYVFAAFFFVIVSAELFNVLND